MDKKHLEYVGKDNRGRLTFRCVEDGHYLCFVEPLRPRDCHGLPEEILEACASGRQVLHTKEPVDDFDGEPDYPTWQRYILEPVKGER
jgi:hypothetical protein